MSATSVGYDMICCLSQDSINAGFQKLSNTGFISSLLESNGIALSVISGSESVSSYLRAGVMPPVLSFADGLAADRALLKFRFYKLPFDRSAKGAPVSTWAVNGTDTIYTYAEPLKAKDSSGNPTQIIANVYYWVRTINKQEYLVPSFRYFLNDQEVLVNMDGMNLIFAVALNTLGLDANTASAMTAQGDLPPEVSTALNQVYFNSNEFSVQHLFLDLDHNNLASLQLVLPAGTTDSVTACSVTGKQVISVPKSEFSAGGKFYLDFQSNLEYTFALGQKNQFGSTPYLLGFQAAIRPGTALPANAPQLLYPTYIGYSGTYNRNQPSLSTLNFQVMGGANPKPPTTGGLVNHFQSNIVTDPGNTGAMLLAAEAFFNPFVLHPIQSMIALPGGGGWSQNANTFSYGAHSSGVIDQQDNVTAGMGSKYVINQYLTGNHNVVVRGPNQVVVSGTVVVRITITITIVDWIKDFDCTWEKSATLNYNNEIDLVVDDQQQVAFNITHNPPQVSVSDVTKDAGASFVDAMGSIFSTLSAGHFDTISNVVDQIAGNALNGLQNWTNSVNQNLNTNFQTYFISPLGQQYQIFNPRFDDQFNFLLDLYQPGLFPVGYTVNAPANPAQLRSLMGDNKAFFTFRNVGQQDVEIDWINYDGQLATPGSIVPKQGGSIGTQTFITHPFLVKGAQPMFVLQTTAPLDDGSFQEISVGDGYVALPTSEDKKVKSMGGGAAVNVNFMNGTGYPAHIYWVDGNGQRQLYTTLANGQSVLQPTFSLHFWSIYDDFDNCIGLYFIAGSQQMTITLGKLNPNNSL